MQKFLQKLSIWLFRKSFDLPNNKKVKKGKEKTNNGSTKNFNKFKS